MSPIREFFGPEGSMAAFVATAYIHGGILVYGSQEVGYPGKINFFNYVEIDWEANPHMYDEYCDLIRVYNNEPALRKGSIVPYPDDNVLMFERVYGEESILVVINMRDTQHQITLPQQWQGRTCTDLVSGKTLVLPAEADMLRPFEYYVVK
jgi:glycosidase